MFVLHKSSANVSGPDSLEGQLTKNGQTARAAVKASPRELNLVARAVRQKIEAL